MSKKIILITALAVLASGCGRFDRWVSGITGDASVECVKGVTYYMFTTGAAPGYDINGKLIPCN